MKKSIALGGMLLLATGAFAQKSKIRDTKSYLSDQLKAFASGTRRNDSHGQMRNMARPMSSNEIEQVADFYARRGQEAQNR